MPPRVAFTLGCLKCDLVAALHGPADVRGDLAFLPMGGSGFIIADISDPANITEISRLDFGPHNQNQLQHNPLVEEQTDRVYLTYLSGSLGSSIGQRSK